MNHWVENRKDSRHHEVISLVGTFHCVSSRPVEVLLQTYNFLRPFECIWICVLVSLLINET